MPMLRVESEASRWLLYFLLGTHLGALITVFTLPLELDLQLLLSFLIFICLVRAMRRHVFRNAASAIRRVEWDGEGEWRLFLASGEELTAKLCPSSYVQPWLLVLNFSSGRFVNRSLILTSDAMDPDLLRRLRMHLRLSYPCSS